MKIQYLYILGTVFLTAYGQIILKWRIKLFGDLPNGLVDKLIFLLKLLLDPFICSGFVAAFIASLCWMAAMTKFDISFAYPFMSLNFIIVFLLSILLLGECFTYGKLIGLILIIMGIIFTVRM